ncbi:MAG: glycoside hydrolase family 65 protein [Microthrixaceae bacterium]
MNPWLWSYEGFEPAEEGQREALCTLGNGYVATRGSLSESCADGVHYPGTYAAGVFNRLSSDISGRTVTNESVVNLPDWTVLRCRVEGGDWFALDRSDPSAHRLELDLRRSVLTRHSRLVDNEGRIVELTERRFVSLRDPHLLVIESTWVPRGFTGTLQIRSALDGTVTNSGVPRYSELPADHLTHVDSAPSGDETVLLAVRTNDSDISIVEAARTRVSVAGRSATAQRSIDTSDRWVASDMSVEVSEDQEVTVEKVVSLFTSRDDGIYSPRVAALEALASAGEFDELLERHVTSWAHAWNRCRLDLAGDVGHTQRVLNLHLFHLLQTVSKNTAELDVGVPARGLHGEAYRGHIFWDELFIFPFLTLRIPELTRALLHYRSRRLDRARNAARAAGFAGAMFPWQSGSDGSEETQTLHLNPDSGRWLPDASHLQRHINAAVVYNVWQYWKATADLEFMRFWGAELVLEIARFWASACTYNHSLDRYEILGVVGPDEYHESYPDREEPGLDNNAYTNLMATWCLVCAFETLDLLPASRRNELIEKMQITHEELDRWGDISRKMRLCFHADNTTDSGGGGGGGGGGEILSQFEGFELLREFDWDGYRERYGDISRLDRILEAEGDSPDRYQLSKQADTLMLFHLFSPEELAELLERLGYECDEAFFERNLGYYEARTSHGSTLSQMVHSWLHSRLDPEHSWRLFRNALASDINDVQGGTTREGIHLGAMAGTVDLVQRCYGGIGTRDDVLTIDPRLPEELHELCFSIVYRSQQVDLRISTDRVTVRLPEDALRGAPLEVDVRGQHRVMNPGDTFEVEIR